MTEHNSDELDETPAHDLDRALAENQRLERDERDADIARQHSADERIVKALTEK